MNAIELLSYIFDEVEDEFAVFAGDNEILYSVTNLPETLDDEVDLVELMAIGSNTVVGVPIDNSDFATFRLIKGDMVVNVALFKNPIPEGEIPEFVETFNIPIQNGWTAEIATDTFYTFDEVFGVPDGVTKNVIGGKDDPSTVEVEAPEEDRGLVDSADAADDAHVEAGAAAEREGDVHGGEPGDEGPSHNSGSDDERSGDAGEDRASGSPDEPTSEGSGDDEVAGPQYLNDAEILGTEPAGLGDFLSREASFLIGEMWGQRDRRNTQDTEWKTTSMPWGAWIGGQPGDKNTPAWGFSRHPEGKDKAGASIVLGSSVGGARKAKAMDTMFAMGLDIDSGAKLDDVLDTVEDKGLLCFVYTSYNNGKQGIELKRDEVLRKLQITSDPTNAQVRQFLREFDKNRYEETFIAECFIKTQKHQTTEGVKIVLDTPPLEKFRLIFPLADPVKIIDLAETHQAALDLWEDKITGLARNVLGVHFDTSCTDPSRLFYTARHPKGSDDWYAAIVMGDPLSFEAVEAYKKSSYTSNREVNAFTMAGGDDGDERPPMCLTPSGKSLNEWHSRFKDRFMIADLLETLCPDKVRVAGGEAQGHVHIECPFEHEHTSEGGTATMAINCLDSQNEYWTIFCHHDACQGRHKLQYLEEMLRQGWFDEDALWDLSQGFVLEAEDEEEDEEEEEAEPAYEGDEHKTPEQRAEEFDTESSDDDIRKFIKRMFREGVDMTTQANITAIIAKNTNLGKRDVKKFWKELEDAQRKRDREQAKSEKGEGSVCEVNKWDFIEQVEYASRRIHDVNREKPRVFHYMENLCVIRENSEGHARMRFLDKDGFANFLNTIARFVRVSGEDQSSMGVSAPNDVVSHLYADDYGQYPDLRGLVTTPTFTRSGALLTEPGYDWSSKLYYKPDATLSVKKVSAKPGADEVYEAKRLLIEEILADFPLGALSRPEIVEKALKGEGVPAVTNMMALILLPFMREMVDGPTPGHLLVKPAPGTGASLLTDVFSIIATGQVTPALAMPSNKDEMSKTLTSVLSNGQNIVFFDNINHSVDSGELASAMTTPTYQARILGKSQTIEVDVRCSWVFTGNNVTLSSELVRRLIMIDLDARLENPEMRTGFRHSDIRGWASENRGDLVWACLTIIQNWVAQGMKHQKDSVLASYENWSGAVGGVLEAAGLGGFMGNREALKASSTDNESDDVLLLIEAWWDQYGTKPITTKGDGEKITGLIELAVSEDLSLPVRKELSVDGDRTYNAGSFGSFLAKYKNRVFKLEDGQQVTVLRDDKRTKRGYQWTLEPKASKPQSNVGDA
ncbi:hypothetical protein [Phaeobacter phage MD18]|nr:hypothetical protein [Phaeobacter phage MD18]